MTRRRIGYVISGLAIVFLSFDSVVKLLRLPVAMQATTQLGLPEHLVFSIGVTEIVCLVVYVIPSASVLGAVLLTGYLGGAVATHVRVGSPLFAQVLFPTYVAALVWGGLFLREDRLRALLPLRR